MGKKDVKKIYVLDTNVILRNWESMYSFEEHDVVITTMVLSELDTFKKGNSVIHFNARHAVSAIDELRQQKTEKGNKTVSLLSHGGVSLGKNLGKLKLVLFKKHSKSVGSVFPEKTVDNSLLSTVDNIQKDNPHCDVILVTKDVNLRVKADSLGLLAEDYKKDQLKDINKLPKGKLTIDDMSLSEIIKVIYTKGIASYLDLDKKIKSKLKNNLYVILKAGKKSVLVKVDTNEKVFVRKEKKELFCVTPKNAEQTFAMDAVLDNNIKLVTLYGPAGTGKTLIAIVAALELLKQKQIKRIIISAAIVPVDNKDIGFLPGDAVDKISPYMGGIYDNISFIKGMSLKNGDREYVDIFNSTDDDKIEIQPLSFVRGRSFTDTVFIMDEAQNTTPHEMLTAITRCGQNTKMILCGDIKQIDSPYVSHLDNGLVHVISRFQGEDIYANVCLEKGERSFLATRASTLLV